MDVVLYLTEVGAIEQLLKTHDLGALVSSLSGIGDEVADSPLWLILTATEDGFADAAAWTETVIAGIDFC